ncbi:hypothetical protein [Agriterribacter sp.]|uniref:hypothetical protein n=1 Tax=Agriterribacter sp. TaxID=2821509 RepID=UPI002CA26843|nr:hypothetical protein [Agriterribacter sp.]HTN06618.1 hypothetical protein [Agriterribacter sp.]
MNVLRKLFFIFMLSLLVKNGFGQEQYYIYIQSQPRQPFYVRMGSATFTSSGNGYLLIPGLLKNTYELIIGFPGAKVHEWRFNCTINETDLGFTLKNKGVAELQLLYLDQKEGLTGTAVEQYTEVKPDTVPFSGVISNDPFSAMLAGVVNDPSIRQQLVIADKKVAAPVSGNNAAAESSVASTPAVLVTVNKDNNKPAIETATPVTVVREEAKVAVAEPEVKKNETFAVREIEKTNATQTEKSAKAGAVQKGDKTVAANVQKQYEPFVVKEIVTKRDDAEIMQAPQTAAKKDTDNNEAVKYLPFVIKPADKTDNKEAAKSSNAVTEKQTETVVADVAEKKTEPQVLKNADKPVPAEKGKTVKSGAAIPVITTQKEKPPPAAQKTILSVVKKTLERKSRDGVDLIYIDENVNGAKDTIRIFIPVLK